MELTSSLQSPFSALMSVSSLSSSPRLTRRTPSPRTFFVVDSEIRNKNSEIATFSNLIDEWLYFYEIGKLIVYTGMLTPENPDKCKCLIEYYRIKHEMRIVTNYNICYKQFYLFARIFKKLVNCKGGKCITEKGGKVHRFTQNSYCCGYYSAVAAVIYRYYQIQSRKFPGTKYNINFADLTLQEINKIVDEFSSARVNSMIIKLFNLSISYTSYFHSYSKSNPIIPSSFTDITTQNCRFDYDDDKIQLATIYAKTNGITTTYHHFCTYNKNKYIIISDSWAELKLRRPLWTRFVSASDFSHVINMIQDNKTLSSEQLEIIKKFFLQPGFFLPNIKISYITVDFTIQNEIIYANGNEMDLNRLPYLMGGT